MKLTSMMLYNAAVKIAGNVVTFKTYEETQSCGYIAAKESGKNKMVAAADLMLEMKTFELRGYYINKTKCVLENGLYYFKDHYSTKVKWTIEKYFSDDAKKDRFIKSCRRAKSRIFDLIACNVDKHRDYEGNKVTTKFLTLTFKENMQDLETANSEITKFLKRLSYKVYGINKNVIKYVCVPELQKRGAWHYHIILFNMKYVLYTKLLKTWGKGGLYITALKKGLDSTTIAKYVTKYISKGISVVEGKGKTIINNEKDLEFKVSKKIKCYTEFKEVDPTDGDKRLSDYDNYKKNNMQNKKRYQCSRGLIKPFESKVKISRSEWSMITKFLINNSKLDKEGEKEVYFETIDNEYRGQINILVVEIGKDNINSLKRLLGVAYDENRSKYSKEYKVDWKYIKNVNQERKKNEEKNIIEEQDDLYKTIKRIKKIRKSITNYADHKEDLKNEYIKVKQLETIKQIGEIIKNEC